MDLYHDLGTNAITSTLEGGANATTPFEIKGGQGVPIRVQPHRDGVPELYPTGSTLVLGFKEDDDFTGSYLTSATAWTVPDNASGYYTSTVSFNTAAIIAAISGKSAIEGVESEMQYQPAGALLPIKSLTFPTTIQNWVNRGSEGTTPESALSLDARVTMLETTTFSNFTVVVGILTYTGGGATALDGQSSAGTLGRLVIFVHPTDGFRVFEVVATNAAESSPDIVRADDNLGVRAFLSRI